MNRNQLLKAWGAGATIVWNDPAPIKGNDYRVTTLKTFIDGTAEIEYNKGNSFAEVFISELEIMRVPDKVKYTLRTVADLMDEVQRLIPTALEGKVYDIRSEIESLKEDIE